MTGHAPSRRATAAVVAVLCWPFVKIFDVVLGPPVKAEEAYWDG